MSNKATEAQPGQTIAGFGGERGTRMDSMLARRREHRDKHYLRGRRGDETFRRMLTRTAILSGAQFVIEGLASNVHWKDETAEGLESDTEAKRALDIVKRSLANIDWTAFVADAMSAGPFGHAEFEIVLTVDEDGSVLLADLAPRPQESISDIKLDERGRVVAIKQETEQGEVSIEGAKIVHIRFHPDMGNPRGRPWLLACYDDWHDVAELTYIENTGIARELSGFPVMRAPVEVMSTSPTSDNLATRQAAEQVLEDVHMGMQTGLLLTAKEDRGGNPTGWDFGLLTSGGSRAINVSSTIERRETRELIAYLCEWLFLGTRAKTGGGNALADAKTDMTELAVLASVRVIANAWRQQVLPLLMYVNGIDDKSKWPRRVHGPVERANLNQLGDYIAKLVSVGAIDNGPKLKVFLRDAADAPLEEVVPEEDKVPTAAGDALELTGGKAAETTALNGAQVTSAILLMERVANGLLPRESGLAAMSLFYNLSPESAQKVMSTIGAGFVPKPMPGTDTSDPVVPSE